MTHPFAGRTALVTGGGNGLGRAIALAFAAHGARVVVVGRDPAKLTSAAEEIGLNARWVMCDISSSSAVSSLATDLADEQISILVNSAGIAGPVASLVDIDVEDWDEVFAVNVRGTFLICKAFLPAMISRGSGDVINLASVSGKRPLARRTPYTASKMAVIGLTATLAHEPSEAKAGLASLDSEFFRHATGHLASGIVVVTGAVKGTPAGPTCQSFSSLSLHSPLILLS